MEKKKQFVVGLSCFVILLAIVFFLRKSSTLESDSVSIQLIQYENTEYGFTFSLPDSWKGYSIIVDHWQGKMVKKGDSAVPLTGPKLFIRNPQWTADDPRQDIPIMVFSNEQWDYMKTEKMSVSAAPIPPSELGRNKQYVFALPARYNFSFLPGYEEVDIIIKDNIPFSINEVNILE